MRSVVLCLLLAVAVAVAEYDDQPIEEVEEEDVEVDEDDTYSHYPDEEQVYYRRKRETYEPGEHVRVKRCCEDRVRRSTDYVRTPRQVHQYEVHEFNDEHDPSSPPYEEMLAASADHYHRVYAAPGAPKTARYLNPDVSPQNVLSASNHQPSNHAKGIPLPNNAYSESNHPRNVLSAPSNHQPFNHAQIQPSNILSGSNQPINGQVLTLHQQNHRQLNQPSPFLSNQQAPGQFHVPLSPVSSPREVPLPVASAPLVPLQQLDVDQSVAAAGHQHKHAHGHSQGGGHGNHAKHFNEQGSKTTKGFNQDHYVDKGGKGHKTDELHKKEYEEALGKKKKHHDQAGHKGSHEEEAHGHRGAKFDEKKGHKKGHKTKGYHNKYHKDEFHKEHKFYDDYHKSGEHHRYGKFNAKHASNESGKKKAHHVNAGHDFVERGKKGYSNKGHVDADNKGHDGKQGHEEHHQTQSSHGKKGGKEGGSHWGYAKKN